MLNGELDPSTPLSQAVALSSIFNETKRSFHAIPLAGHVTSLVLADGINLDCPRNMIINWLFPEYYPGSSTGECINSMPTTIDFVGKTLQGQQVSMQLFGVSKPFGK